MYRINTEQRLAMTELADLAFRVNERGGFVVLNYSSFGSVLRIEVDTAPPGEPTSEKVVQTALRLMDGKTLERIENINAQLRELLSR